MEENEISIENFLESLKNEKDKKEAQLRLKKEVMKIRAQHRFEKALEEKVNAVDQTIKPLYDELCNLRDARVTAEQKLGNLMILKGMRLEPEFHEMEYRLKCEYEDKLHDYKYQYKYEYNHEFEYIRSALDMINKNVATLEDKIKAITNKYDIDILEDKLKVSNKEKTMLMLRESVNNKLNDRMECLRLKRDSCSLDLEKINKNIVTLENEIKIIEDKFELGILKDELKIANEEKALLESKKQLLEHKYLHERELPIIRYIIHEKIDEMINKNKANLEEHEDEIKIIEDKFELDILKDELKIANEEKALLESKKQLIKHKYLHKYLREEKKLKQVFDKELAKARYPLEVANKSIATLQDEVKTIDNEADKKSREIQKLSHVRGCYEEEIACSQRPTNEAITAGMTEIFG